MEKILIEKQVWKSTLNRSMVLEAENEQLKELLKECRGSIEVDLDNARMCESYTDTEYFKGLIARIDEVLK